MSLKFSNTTSDYLKWDTILNLIRNIFNDGNYQMSLLISLGSFWGLRISDLLNLTWIQILNTEQPKIFKKKSGKDAQLKSTLNFKNTLTNATKQSNLKIN